MGRTRRAAIDNNGPGFNTSTGIEWYARAVFSNDGSQSTAINPAFIPSESELDYISVQLPFAVGPVSQTVITVWGQGLLSFGSVTLAQQHFMMASSSITDAISFPGYYYATNFGDVAFSVQIDVGYRDFEPTATLVDPFSLSTTTTVTFNEFDAEPVVYINWDGAVALIRSGATQFAPGVFNQSSNVTVSYPDDLAPVTKVVGTENGDILQANFQVASDYNGSTIVKRASDIYDALNPRSLDGAFDFRPDPNVTDAQLVPHATVRGEWGGQPDYYSFTVAPEGGRAVFDIDATSFLFDSVIRLFSVDQFGNLTFLAENDDDFSGDAGNSSIRDSLLTYQFTTGGTYVLQVDKYQFANPPADTTYVLNVSLPRAQLAQPTIGSSNVADFGVDGGAVDGGDGDDILIGSAGDDVLDGGIGNDVASFETAINAVIADLRWGEAHGDGDDRLLNIENLTGGAGNDVLRANEYTNTLRGGGGSDTLLGREGDDTLFGDSGNDYLDGGLGNDTANGGAGDDSYYIDSFGDIVSEGENGGYDTIYTEVDYTIASAVERLATRNAASTAALNLTGNAFANSLVGNAGANVLDGRGGADSMTGLGGNDVYVVDNAADDVVEAAAGGYDTVFSSVHHSLAANVERIVSLDPSSTAALNFTGNALNNEMTGNAGANILDGGAGADLMIGGAGDDVYFVDNTGDVVSDAPGGGYDTVFTSTNFLLTSLIERVVAVAGNATTAITLTGNEFANEITGNAGTNQIDGKTGSDLLIGGGGADAFVFSTALGASNIDSLPDFAVGQDRIYLDHSIFAALGMGALSAGAFKSGSAATHADDRIIYDPTTGKLYYDADGNGGGAAVQFAVLHEGLNLTAADFYVV